MIGKNIFKLTKELVTLTNIYRKDEKFNGKKR